MTFSSSEMTRYKRHFLLKEIGVQGQQQLKNARVLLVGAGGLGAPALLYLAAAGVGHIGLIDDDLVDLSNLQRQIVFNTESVGNKKVEEAKKAALALNPEIEIQTYNSQLDADNALEIIGQYDIVGDGSDNFATRYLVNDACYLAKKPLVFAAVGPFDGQLSTFKAFEKDASGQPNPSYRCVFPETNSNVGAEQSCNELGVLGPVVGIMGTLQATEIIKEILEIGDAMVGQLLLVDALATRFTKIKIKWLPDNPLNGKNAIFTDLSHHPK